ncbi:MULTISPECIES: hypothetical protein [Mycolicibacterium]|jgi:hypothetical protein|uniref:Secreted protein n=2 Tax=Mycolicibacterium fortuitum TaxID=1766 RepID=A0ABD6QFB0_MYCFO|nr:hypothetical protein [Mycolicibacterium fortuitum]MCA4724471.1 hypothetical protein [Mycolicibacterium fortuitum]OBA97047.1 hypothetical protein A5665_28195 [Mycolicibacterium fortuitum]OBI55146.1 hypothetical protein A5667_24585 [Mycolicibacterium fortuitum]OBI60436.1 hypothetical protein A5666_15830 [Mycolicibacterium fortuitum]OBK08730.1 hypothetical protein A5637_31285 [Mycolicibacterium fortuitum]
MEPAGGFVVTSDARYRTGVVTALLAFGLGAGVAAAVPARADDAPMVHRVTYTVTAEQPTTVGIYYREVDPPTWADYSHNPYEFSPRDDLTLEPGKPWVRETMLADPMKWAMVTVTTAGLAPQPTQTLRCELAIDGIVVDRADGPKGALCSLRNW